MRIVLISDTHGDFFSALEIVKRHKDNADCFIHLGDGLKEWEDLKDLFPELRMLSVRGNCDLGYDAPGFSVLPLEDGHRLFYTHGHLYSVKSSIDPIMEEARRNGCDIVAHGHTHTSFVHYEDGLYLICPGSPSRPSDSPSGYGIIDITRAGIVTNKVKWSPYSK